MAVFAPAASSSSSSSSSSPPSSSSSSSSSSPSSSGSPSTRYPSLAVPLHAFTSSYFSSAFSDLPVTRQTDNQHSTFAHLHLLLATTQTTYLVTESPSLFVETSV
ncbi:hypothetical protein IWX49DRAFT_555487 [Phyllosticta citricarpa]|uniref:REJ domain-containing protein n=1 Tax=Phyllosticta citricarpa TaxID=55181 RepID=A0ABR1LYG8_9PEZI